MPAPFSVRDQDDPTRDLGEWTEDGSIRLPGDLDVAGDLTVTGTLTIDNTAITGFSRSATYITPAANTYVKWRAVKACVVTAVRGYRVAGSGAVINAQVGANDLLAVDLSLTSAAAWISSTTIQNATLAAGDTLTLEIVSVAGSPDAVTVQVDLETP